MANPATTTAQDRLNAATAAQSTQILFESLATLDAKAGEWLVGLTPEEVIVRSTLIDTIEARHNLHDAVLDAMDELPDEASYPMLLLRAMDLTGQSVAVQA